jgi:hypothetical protein
MQAIATLQAIQSRHFLAYLLGLLTDAHLKAGQDADAMKAAPIARRAAGSSANRPQEQGEASFRTATEIATTQGARTL